LISDCTYKYVRLITFNRLAHFPYLDVVLKANTGCYGSIESCLFHTSIARLQTFRQITLEIVRRDLLAPTNLLAYFSFVLATQQTSAALLAVGLPSAGENRLILQ
jgi:hypothetical protein